MTTTLTSLETQPGWLQAGNSGDSGGGSSKPNGTFTIVPGDTVFSAKGNYPYNNGYWYLPITGNFDADTLFSYSLQFMLPTAADLSACQAVEFELQQNVGGNIYNMAWQADIKGSGLWRTFNYTTSAWEATTIPVKLIAGEWTAITATFLRSASGTLTHVDFTLNGVTTPINVTRAATPMVQSDYLHAAFQLDSNGMTPPTPYICHVKGMTVTATPTAN